MQNIVLINGRFELLNNPDRIELFDIKNINRDGDGLVIPLGVIPLDAPLTDREAGKRVLSWLLDSGYLDQSEYFHFADIFLAAQPPDGAAIRQSQSLQGRL